MNKGARSKQFWLLNKWFENDGNYIIQPMFFQNYNGIRVQKRIQKFLEEKGL